MAKMTTIEEIKSAVSQFQNDSVWMSLRRRWEQDLELYRLKPYDAGKSYYSYTSNAPRIFADKLISMLVESKLIVRFPLDNLNKNERAIASAVERFIYGCLNLNDQRFLRSSYYPSLRQQMAWHLILRGSVGCIVYVYKNERGETVPFINIWDVYNTSYARGASGLLWGAYCRKATAEQVESEYGVKIAEKECELIDFWDDTNNAVIAGNVWAKKPTPHGLGHCPVYIFQVGSMPVIKQGNDQYTGKYTGESCFCPNRYIYPILNKTVSDLANIVRRGVKVPMGHWTADGTSNIQEDIWQTEKGGIVPLRLEDKVQPLMPPSMPADASTLVNFVMGDLQRGALPHTAYGELGFRLSGFAINQLQGSMTTVIEPAILAAENIYTMISMSLVDQFGESDFAPVQVRGKTSRNELFGMPKYESISPDQIPKGWYPETRLEPVLPKDDAQKAQLANMYRQGNVPLLSMRTIRDEIIGVEDPDLEAAKVDQEWGDTLIVNRLWKAYVQAIADGDRDVARNILVELRRVMAGQQQPPQGEKLVAPSNLEGMSMESEGTGIPPEGTGMPSSTLPSESMGGYPGGAANARTPPLATEG